MAATVAFPQARKQSIELGALVQSPPRIQQSGMARGLAESEERREHLQVDLVRDATAAPQKQGPIVLAQLVVESALTRSKRTVDRLFGLRGEVGEYLGLRATQDEGTDRAGDGLDSVRAVTTDGAFESRRLA